MDKIILIKELLLEIINYCEDANDWFNFMFTSKNIYLCIYPEFIFKQFTFMIFHSQTLPLCIRNTNLKYYYIEDFSRESPYYITTNQNLIMRHCQLHRVRLYKIYGIFFQGLYLAEYGYPEINYEKILDLIDNNIHNNIHNKYIFGDYNLIPNKQHLKMLNEIDTFEITEKFIKNFNKEYYRKNMANAGAFYRGYIKSCIWGISGGFHEPLPLLPKNKLNVCAYCNTKYINDDELFHKNWLMLFEMHWDTIPDEYLYHRDYKKNSCYHPISQKIENI